MGDIPVSQSIASPPGATPVRSRDALPAVAALALMVSLPFLNPIHLAPLMTFFEECLALGLGLAALACIAFRRDSGPVSFPAISIWALALSLVLLLQPRWSEAPYSQPATIAGLYVLWAAALMWVGAQMRLVNAERIATVLATAMVLAAIIAAAASWIQVLGLNADFGNLVPPIPHRRASGLLAQVNMHANHLLVGSASLVYLWSRQRISSAAALGCGTLLASGIAFAASRATLLELGALLVVSLWFRSGGAGEPRARPFWVGVAAFTLLLALCAAAASVGFQSLGISERTAHVGEASQYLVRLGIYEAAIRIWLSAPIAGVGVGGFAWAHYTTPTPWVGVVPMRPEPYAHDVLLQLLTETGLIGAGIFVAAVILWLLANARRTLATAAPWHIWAVGIVAIELVHSLLEYPLWHAHFLGLTALLMGFCDRRGYRMGSSILSRGLALGTAAIGAFLLGTTVKYQLELLYWGSMPQALKSDPQVRDMERQAVQRLQKSLLAPYIDISVARALPVSPDNLEAQLRFMGRAMHFWPVADVVHKQIVLLAMAAKNDEALALIGNLARLQPQYLPGLDDDLKRISTQYVAADSPVRVRVRELAERQRQRS
jgi:O-antigen ligase